MEAAGGDDGALSTCVCLDRTVAYPAGGGQPSDTGRIVGSGGGTFIVKDVKAVDGVVRHLGVWEEEGTTSSSSFALGDEVTVHVDVDRRLLHARIHSAGHLLDVAMTNIGYGPDVMVPAKGLHAPDQAYVEYNPPARGAKPAVDKEKLIADLTVEMNRLVKEGGASKSGIMSYDDAAKACGGSLPPYISADSSPRIVTILEGTEGCPCGGTHVADVKEIGSGVNVTAVRVKKGVTRVSYTIEGMKDHKP